MNTYINAFIDAFIIREAKRYDVKGRGIINSTRKYYFTDPGLRNARLDFIYPDEGQILENILYNELIYNGYNVNVGSLDTVEKDKEGKSRRVSYEIDFIATKNKQSMYLQIAENINRSSTKKREIRPFILLNDQIRKYLIINRPIKPTKDENGFDVVGVADFLLNLN